MKRNVILKSNAEQTFAWLNDWFYRNSTEVDQGSFRSNILEDILNPDSPEFIQREWLVEQFRERLKLSDQEYRSLRGVPSKDFYGRFKEFIKSNTSIMGKFSDLLVNNSIVVF